MIIQLIFIWKNDEINYLYRQWSYEEFILELQFNFIFLPLF